MAADPPAATDAYAAAKGNIRDTIKWLAATFASLAAVVVAGTSVSGIGSLPIPGVRFFGAAASLLLGFICVLIALWKTLRLLRTEGLFASELLSPPEGGSDARELTKVRKEILAHQSELLPPNYPTIDELLAASRLEQVGMQEAIKKRDAAAFQRHEAQFNELDAFVSKIMDFAIYSRLYHRLNMELPWLFGFATTALIFLFTFACLVNDKHDKAGSNPPSQTFYMAQVGYGAGNGAEREPDLDPVLFTTGSAEVTKDGLAAINRVREYLAKHPDALVLLLAHTDTVASEHFNASLARKRGDAVRRLLIEPGGIAPGRVFVSEVAKVALVNVIRNDTADERNRSVEFLLTRVAGK